jgi:hypothetical protein
LGQVRIRGQVRLGQVRVRGQVRLGQVKNNQNLFVCQLCPTMIKRSVNISHKAVMQSLGLLGFGLLKNSQKLFLFVGCSRKRLKRFGLVRQG